MSAHQSTELRDQHYHDLVQAWEAVTEHLLAMSGADITDIQTNFEMARRHAADPGHWPEQDRVNARLEAYSGRTIERVFQDEFVQSIRSGVNPWRDATG